MGEDRKTDGEDRKTGGRRQEDRWVKIGRQVGGQEDRWRRQEDRWVKTRRQVDEDRWVRTGERRHGQPQ